MRIGVWNLECVSFRKRNPDRLVLLRARDAGIWVLTETHAEIDLSPTHSYAVHSKSRVKSRNDMHWVSVWSQYPFIERLDFEDVRVAGGVIAAPTGPLLVYGTVWPWQSDTGEHPSDPAWGSWQRQAPVIAQQASQWSKLKAQWPDADLCIAGDLNMTFGGPNPSGSRAGRLEAAIAMQRHDLVCTTAWPRLSPCSLNASPIDHILLPYELARRSRVCDTWDGRPRDPDRLSDHSGLIIEVAV